MEFNWIRFYQTVSFRFLSIWGIHADLKPKQKQYKKIENENLLHVPQFPEKPFDIPFISFKSCVRSVNYQISTG